MSLFLFASLVFQIDPICSCIGACNMKEKDDFNNLAITLKKSEFISVQDGEYEIELHVYDRFKNPIACKVCVRSKKYYGIKRKTREVMK